MSWRRRRRIRGRWRVNRKQTMLWNQLCFFSTNTISSASDRLSISTLFFVFSSFPTSPDTSFSSHHVIAAIDRSQHQSFPLSTSPRIGQCHRFHPTEKQIGIGEKPATPTPTRPPRPQAYPSAAALPSSSPSSPVPYPPASTSSSDHGIPALHRSQH